jgi:hypothetical protein
MPIKRANSRKQYESTDSVNIETITEEDHMYSCASEASNNSSNRDFAEG